MSNLLDYIAWRGDLSFSASPFNEVDNLLFSMLSFVDLEGIVPGQVQSGPVRLEESCQAYFHRYPEGGSFGVLIPEMTGELFRQAAACRRYREVYLTCYRNELDEDERKQFAAVTFLLPDNSLFAAFRGTDDTLTGWYEDFQLSFLSPTPSQQAAVSYLEEVAGLFRGDIRLGGHSKGGNLALYAAVHHNRWFSKAACISSAIGFCMRPLMADMRGSIMSSDTRIYLSWGTKEAWGIKNPDREDRSSKTYDWNKRVADQAASCGAAVKMRCQVGGGHCEADWEKLVPEFMDFLWMQ